MNAVTKVSLELSVLLGKAVMPIRQLLKMGRGAVIDLDTSHEDLCRVYVNGGLIARGEVLITGDRIGVQIVEMVKDSTDTI